MNHLGDDFRDLAPLDPGRDPERWERMVGGIVRAAGPELERRAALAPSAPGMVPGMVPGMMTALADWMRPTLSAAALMAAAAGAFLAVGQAGTAAAPVAEESSLAAALGYPTAVAGWVEGGDAPQVEDVVFALEGESR